jgi:hypothetical protein
MGGVLPKLAARHYTASATDDHPLQLRPRLAGIARWLPMRLMARCDGSIAGLELAGLAAHEFLQRVTLANGF